MPENWKKYKLGDVCELRNDSISPKKFNNEAYIGLEHIGQGTFLLDGIGSATDVASNKYKFQSGDILYGKIRPYFKKVYRPNFSGICSTDMLIFISKDENLARQDFLYHIFKTQEFTDRATETSSGTKMPRADWNSLKQIVYNFPPLPEQRAIASILSALDDKIENNLAMNKTLEDMAMALYKHWFVDFGPFQEGNFIDSELGPIPEGWNVKTLEELGKISYGKMPKKNLKTKSGYPINSGYGYVGFYPEYNCEKGKVIVVARGVGGTGEVKITKEKCYLTNLSICIKNNLELIDDSILFYELKRNNLHYLRSGSAQPQITINDLNSVTISIPPKKTQNDFSAIFKPLVSKMGENEFENQTLAELRDTLLPKLISGEVRLKEFEQQVSKVL